MNLLLCRAASQKQGSAINALHELGPFSLAFADAKTGELRGRALAGHFIDGTARLA